MSPRSSGRVANPDAAVLVVLGAQCEFGNDSPAIPGDRFMRARYVTPAEVDRLASDLSDREFAILETLGRVRLASAVQLERLHLTSGSVRNRRRILQTMTDRRLVARLDRVVGGRRSGSAGYLYALDVAGLRVLDLKSPNGHPRRPTTPGAPFVAHVLDVTELYVRLVEVGLQGDAELLDFQAEPASWRRYPGIGGGTAVVKPDAYVRLGSGEFEDSWFVEVDRGTESPSTLVTKLDTYRAYWSSGKEQARRGVFPRVLWLVPNQRRLKVVVDLCARQPAESWRLHQVTLSDDAVGLMTGACA